ncbi:chromosome segregation protein SMC [Anaerotignum lactatifermentans]|uniref:Chromosome partition protein Smc n=1 Tax=Anaerotignum lactatifermentans TaxID=160404 RepID=A0ABS2G881_9FIRM|nr:chromosome segregation protein SMC [Anaerotignum lactatifermentans]MBM6828901.1 chromosome segregation protein SMC [Anaerotignum lactatifermentans]MBM6876925.1 chromosome segregation protein SMC [Anaerotignum lactatifermentans]MBM6950484.1 chromosome segregation protein SMC [Anaerotignum lactatifermentans]
MYLKRLDLQGFKSFPEKVKLEFNPGITAVVGPNGSGKSNVSDAVRWVLGEQRAKSLRGDKMEDVIFAGTENRKPQGFADVTIVIDNQDGKLPIDYTEVQVTRRVFRSGESEYRINGAACRLKDIQELFMDTGVGREGYSIIGQGRIDEILNAKGEERRRIFEEATGIVKYKTRKNEAVAKLEKEQQNLTRVEDIISELESQLEPLEEESRVAEEYLRLKEQLKDAEISMFRTDANRLETEMERLTRQKADAESQSMESAAAQETARERAQSLRLKYEEQTAALRRINEDVAQVKADIEKNEGLVRLTKEQMQHDADNMSRVEKEILERLRQQEEAKKEQEICRSRITALHMTMNQQQERLDRLEEESSSLETALSQKESKAESFKDEIFEQIRIGTEAKGEIAKQEAMKEQFLARKEQLDEELAHGRGRLEEMSVHLQVLEKQEKERREFMEFLSRELDTLEKDSQHAAEIKEDAERQMSRQERLISEKQSRLSLLSEMEKEHEGFFNSVKNLLNLPDRERRGIHGAVGQLLQVEEAYETAIEAALGGAMQNVVTQTEEDARDAIRFLKEHRLGRATFLPITAVKARPLEGHQPILDEKGVIGTADSLVRFDRQYYGIVSNLLGRILIVDHLDEAVRLAKKYQHRYKMVTLEGDIMNPGGAMTGGSRSNKTTGIFGRAREIASLRQEMENLRAQAAAMKDRLQLAEEDLQEIGEQIVEKKLEQQKLLVTLHSAQEQKQKSQEEQKEAAERVRLMEVEEGQLKDQLAVAEADMEAGRNRLASSEALMAQFNAALSEYQENLTEEREKRSSIQEEITAVKISISQSGQSVAAAQENLLRLEKEAEKAKMEAETLRSQKEELEKSGGLRQDQQIDLQKEGQNLRQKEEELSRLLENTTSQISVLAEEMTRCEEQAQEQAETVSRLKNEIFRLETKMEKVTEERQRIFDRMWEEYEITYQTAGEYAQAEERSYSQLSHLAKEWKAQMRAMGDVNTGSIARYREVKERFAFLSAQKADILEAEEKLKGIIEELSQLMERQFKEQFAVISENFSAVFQEMFGGGKAYLRLSDEDKVLDSPIEIVAQPPGKSLQNMQLLSGGERALTAISILFSILKMKPSPFCILDEIEAALDDANVRRYAQFLRRFSKETQFIVITHRKGTMEFADVMYGVTMQEKGISKLISVNFAEQQEFVE